jgi:hypothetical protein
MMVVVGGVSAGTGWLVVVASNDYTPKYDSHTQDTLLQMTTQDKRRDVRAVMHVPSMNGRSAPKIEQSHTRNFADCCR